MRCAVLKGSPQTRKPTDKVLVVHALSASAGKQPKSRGTSQPACTHQTMRDGLKTVRGNWTCHPTETGPATDSCSK